VGAENATAAEHEGDLVWLSEVGAWAIDGAGDDRRSVSATSAGRIAPHRGLGVKSPPLRERLLALPHSPTIPASPAALTRLLLAPANPARVIWAILGLAAIAVGVAGFLHGRLFHQGYSHVTVIGPLFLLNEISSGVVIALLLLRRPWLFALSALGISVGAVVSIVISHTTSLFGFAEHAYSTTATTIVVAECVAAVLVVIALGLAARLGLGAEEAER
jgi:hypothetical protein